MWILLFILACKPDDPGPSKTTTTPVPTPVPTTAHTGKTIPTGTTTADTGDGPTTVIIGDPVLVVAGQDGTPAGWNWLLAVPDQLPVVAAINDIPVDLKEADALGAFMFQVPEDAEIGAATLTVISGLSGDREERPFTIRAPLFLDVAESTGLADVHDTTGYEPGCAQALTGVVFADFDLDGDADAVIGHYGPTTRLLRNDAAPKTLASFVDIADPFPDLDRVASLAVADIDADGDLDLWVGRRGDNRLYSNRWIEEGVFGFIDVTAEWGLVGSNQRTMGAVFGDPDADGDLDLYEINHAWCFPGGTAPGEGADRFLLHQPDHTLVDKTSILPNFAGSVTERMGFSGLFLDYDRDNDLDLFVVNDFVPNTGTSALFRNDDRDALTFTDQSVYSGFGVHPDATYKGVNGMGIDVADLNGDGFPDFPISNIGPNLLLLSQVDPVTGEVTWVDNAFDAGVQRGTLPWGVRSITWGTHFFDHDNDGDTEAFYTGGPILAGTLAPHAFFDNRGDGTFDDLTWIVGLGAPGHGKATSVVDLDQDGFLDLVVANWESPLEVYRNTAGDNVSNHWLAIDLTSSHARVHRDAMGAIVELTEADGSVQTCFRTPRPSMGGGGDTACRFGLGLATSVQEVRVHWPDGRMSTHNPSVVDERILLVDPL